MADFCKQCALDTFGDDIGDLAGISTPEDTASGMYPVVICEGCGPVQVDHTGTRIPATTMPRILNKHAHGIPLGAVYIGRGSPWGNPFRIGPDGTRDEVCDKYDAWLDTQPHLIARLPKLQGRDLVCFCSPQRCHGITLRRRANALACSPA